MSKPRQRFWAKCSSVYAALLWVGVAMIVSNKRTIWSQLGSEERFWSGFAFAYASILLLSGIFYLTTSRRVVGFIHAVLMLVIAGIVSFEIVKGHLSKVGADDAAAGIVATANLVFVVGGGFAAIFGIGVMFYSLSKAELVNETQDT